MLKVVDSVGVEGGKLCEGSRPVGLSRAELVEVGVEELRCRGGLLWTEGGGEPCEGLDPGPRPSCGVGGGGLVVCVGEAVREGKQCVGNDCLLQEGVVKGGGEEAAPQIGARLEPGADEEGAAGFFGKDKGEHAAAQAAALAQKGVLYFL